jgi:hypothetical protein
MFFGCGFVGVLGWDGLGWVGMGWVGWVGMGWDWGIGIGIGFGFGWIDGLGVLGSVAIAL